VSHPTAVVEDSHPHSAGWPVYSFCPAAGSRRGRVGVQSRFQAEFCIARGLISLPLNESGSVIFARARSQKNAESPRFSTTQRYTHLDSNPLREAADMIGAAISAVLHLRLDRVAPITESSDIVYRQPD
jgi:hypothetical protein